MTMIRFHHSVAAACISAAIACPSFALAQQQSFSDVPPDHPAFAAAEYLKSQNIIAGYSDGTFRPDQKVNRAEALKIIIGGLVTQEQLDQIQGTNFSDIPQDAWYLPYVEIAKANGIVDGPPKKTSFLGERPIMKVEFIKMLLLAQKVDPVSAYSEIRLPLSSDVSNVDEWFYPYLRFALASSMTMVGQDGLLHPANELTRGETALLLHRYLMYERGRRTQALLSEAENEIIIILSMLENNNIAQAEYASARALLAARGAHTSKPNEPIVIGALKISEAFRALVRAYRSGVNSDFAQAEKLAKDAWSLAEQAKGAEISLATLGDQVQTIAQNMADSARVAMEKAQ